MEFYIIFKEDVISEATGEVLVKAGEKTKVKEYLKTILKNRMEVIDYITN